MEYTYSSAYGNADSLKVLICDWIVPFINNIIRICYLLSETYRGKDKRRTVKEDYVMHR